MLWNSLVDQDVVIDTVGRGPRNASSGIWRDDSV